MNNDNNHLNNPPHAVDVQNGAFFLKSLGETTLFKAGVYISKPDYKIKLEAVILGTDDKWETDYSCGLGSGNAELPVSFLRPHIHREVELRYYVKTSEGVVDSESLKVRILP